MVHILTNFVQLWICRSATIRNSGNRCPVPPYLMMTGGSRGMSRSRSRRKGRSMNQEQEHEQEQEQEQEKGKEQEAGA